MYRTLRNVDYLRKYHNYYYTIIIQFAVDLKLHCISRNAYIFAKKTLLLNKFFFRNFMISTNFFVKCFYFSYSIRNFLLIFSPKLKNVLNRQFTFVDVNNNLLS